MTAAGPRHVPLKRVATVTTGAMPTRSDEGSIPVMGANGQIGFTNIGNLAVAAIVVGRVGSAGSVNVVQAPAWITDNALVVIPNGGLFDFRYACHVFSTLDLGRDAAQTAQPLITQTMVRERTVPLPSLVQQRVIADYLDAETGRIDALVFARRRTAELAALRLDVYTRQLVGQDDEGHLYDRVPLRRRWSVIDCKHRTPTYKPDGYPLVSPGDATAGRLDLSRCTRFVGQADFDDLTDGPRRPGRGDIIYTRNASIGIACYVDTDAPFTMGQDVCLIRSEHQDQRFLTYVLNTFGMDQLDEQKIGSTFSRINLARVLDLSVPCPGIDDQRRIADELDAATARASRLIDATQRQIDLLLERRQTLVTAAVTGQLEIPGVAA